MQFRNFTAFKTQQMTRYCTLLAVMVFMGSGLWAQDDEFEVVMAKAEPGLVLGATLGYYISNNATANYYNGSGINNIENVIYNAYNYPRIYEALGNLDFTMGDYPESMSYNSSISLGGFVGYRTASPFTPFLEMGITNFKLADAFTLILDDPSTGTTEDDIEVAEVRGGEKRLDFSLGSFYYFQGDRLLPYAEFGVNFNYAELTSNEIYIRSWHYSIQRATNPPTVQGGFGYGAFAGIGAQYRMNARNSFMLGARVDYKSINMVEEGEKATLNLHVLPYLRFMFG